MPIAEIEPTTSVRVPENDLYLLESDYGRGPRGRLFLPETTLIEQGEPMDRILILTRGRLLRIRHRLLGDHISEIEQLNGTGYVVNALAVRGIENLVSPETIRTTTDTRGFWFTPEEIRGWNGAVAPLGRMHGYIDLAAEEYLRSLSSLDASQTGMPFWSSEKLDPSLAARLQMREPFCMSTLRSVLGK